jgi:GAF domain-containing protein
MASPTGDDHDASRQLEDLREQQRAISGVLRAVARSTGLQPVLDEIVEASRRLCDADYGALYLLDQGLLHLATYHGEPESAEYDRQHPHALDRTTGAGRTAVTGEPVHIPDILADPEYVYPGPARYRALLGMPIKVDEDLIGVVVLVRREPREFSTGHIALVQTFADQAAIALTNARLLEAVERQRAELSRFLSPEVAELITSEDGENLLAGHRAYITCLFSDLRGFTAFAETAAPEELFDVLREYRGALGRLIPAYGGTLEHFAGDGLMVFFNDPLPVSDHELRAIRLALAAHERFDELAAEWRKRGIELGLGIRGGGRVCDAWPDRLRGTLRLRSGRPGSEPCLPSEHPCRRRSDSHRPARLRRGSDMSTDPRRRQTWTPRWLRPGRSSLS